MISNCILAGDKDCRGLNERHPHCGSKLCPFYKTVEQERASQRYCLERAAKTGHAFEACYDVGEVE